MRGFIKQIVLSTIIIAGTLLVSCEKEVNIKLNTGEPSLVVEGVIENGLPPYVFLTRSIGYFSTIDLNTLQNSFVRNAKVTVSDGVRTVQLREYSLDTGANGNKLYFYSIDTAGSFFVGQIEKVYKLTIEVDGKIYESFTKIPNPTTIDSMKTVQPDPPFNKEKNPLARQVRIYFKEPDTAGNFVRYFTQRNSEPYYPGSNSVYPDDIINGIYFETTLSLGEPTGREFNRDSSTVGYPGDTVTLKWCSIDRANYTFWSTYEYSLGTLGNPFSTPIQVKSNISNGALGVWTGYGAVYKTIVLE
ncbi:hypothetical protein CAP35_11785 [Chitinophagaceae bacterium IBVUCB1]|jgi:hypothetical protein|nr:hypothetical protein CAP35_11785 [Chitinophagaceae bacterium IBVUCB1]